VETKGKGGRTGKEVGLRKPKLRGLRDNLKKKRRTSMENLHTGSYYYK
jgi:hypothetical protein